MGVSSIPLDITSVLIRFSAKYGLMTYSATEVNAEAPGQLNHAGRAVRLDPLKQFALRLPQSSTLRSVLLAERDTLTVDEFLAKVDTWLRLARLEG